MMATETAAMETVATVTVAVTGAVVPVDGASYMVGKVLQKISKQVTNYQCMWTLLFQHTETHKKVWQFQCHQHMSTGLIPPPNDIS